VALLWKMICNLGDPMSLRHPASHGNIFIYIHHEFICTRHIYKCNIYTYTRCATCLDPVRRCTHIYIYTSAYINTLNTSTHIQTNNTSTTQLHKHVQIHVCQCMYVYTCGYACICMFLRYAQMMRR